MKGKKLVFLAFVLWLYIGSGILFISSVPLARVNSPQEQKDFAISDGESWLTGWKYRKELTIHAAADENENDPWPYSLYNYTIMLDVNYGAGSDSGSSVYCNSHCQIDFDDIRFTDDDGETLLAYWIEELTESDDATFWFRVQDDLKESQTAYIYYGNPVVNTTLTNGTNTFIFFDDFENNNLERWDDSTGTPAITSSVVKMGSYALELYDSGDSTDVSKEISFDYGFLIHAWIRANNAYRGPVLAQQATSGDSQYRIYGDDMTYYDADIPAYVDYAQNEAASDNTWYRAELAYDFYNEKNYAWKDRLSLGNPDEDFDDNGNNAISGITELMLYSQAAYHDYVDDYYVRLWVPTEPHIDAYGEEESAPANWTVVNSVTYTFVITMSEETLWAYYSFILLVGLAMVPLSMIYLAWGGKKAMTTDKLFFGLLLFFLGWAVVVGVLLI